jgi:hypothetical protein
VAFKYDGATHAPAEDAASDAARIRSTTTQAWASPLMSQPATNARRRQRKASVVALGRSIHAGPGWARPRLLGGDWREGLDDRRHPPERGSVHGKALKTLWTYRSAVKQYLLDTLPKWTTGYMLRLWRVVGTMVLVMAPMSLLYPSAGIGYTDGEEMRQTVEVSWGGWGSSLYFSVVALTTLGYGDFAPATVLGLVALQRGELPRDHPDWVAGCVVEQTRAEGMKDGGQGGDGVAEVVVGVLDTLDQTECARNVVPFESLTGGQAAVSEVRNGGADATGNALKSCPWESVMDSFIVDYLRSGDAWLLVGTGPSNAMGYPSWEELARSALDLLREENPGPHMKSGEKALSQRDYPQIFECVGKHLGMPRLLQHLRGILKARNDPKIYDIMAKWPVAVYMTTNWDDEIQGALSRVGESYLTYTNSDAHMSLLEPSFTGGIMKLHGDLRSEDGLVMTSSQYREMCEGDRYAGWRGKMEAVCQMAPLIVVGHSLTDKNIRHVLRAAKLSSGVTKPVCWIAPNVSFPDRKKYLDEFRIRVVGYKQSPGDGHANLVRVLQQLSVFVPSRMSVKMTRETADWIKQGSTAEAAAPALYVYNCLHEIHDSDELQVACLLAVLRSVLPDLRNRRFAIRQALELAGLPTECRLPNSVLTAVAQEAQSTKLLEPTEAPNEFCLVKGALQGLDEQRLQFRHLDSRFRNALVLRTRRVFPKLSQEQATEIAQDIRNALTGYFREGGLTFATALFDEDRTVSLPPCIMEFINRASHKYDDMQLRLAFSYISTHMFTNPSEAERQFLGRLSQGFFAFHSLGILGGAAVERIRSVCESVWLLDSDALIQAVALASPASAAYAACFQRLRNCGVRLFTTTHLLGEAWDHFSFARRVVTENGEDSQDVWASALGDSPYGRSNDFLQGFVNWRAAGNPGGWASYMSTIYGTANPRMPDMERRLGELGIDVVEFSDWPGFEGERDYADQRDYVLQIATRRRRHVSAKGKGQISAEVDAAQRKAGPEAEALVVILRERAGLYHILSEQPGDHSHAWFISNTALLNLLVGESRVTWQSEAFLRFADALPSADANDPERSFGILLHTIARTGVPLLDEDTIARAFKSTIDQTRLVLSQQHERHAAAIEKEYGEPAEGVIERLSPMRRPLAALQLVNQANEHLSRQAAALARDKKEAEDKTEAMKSELDKVAGFRQKLDARKAKGKKTQRQQQSKPGKKKKKKKKRRR